jgi:hypothetical protein
MLNVMTYVEAVDLRVGTAAPLLYRAGEFRRLMPQGESS